MDWTVFHRYLVFLFLYMKMFNFGVSKSSACYNLELIAERFISKVIRIIMIKFERFYKLFGGKTKIYVFYHLVCMSIRYKKCLIL